VAADLETMHIDNYRNNGNYAVYTLKASSLSKYQNNRLIAVRLRSFKDLPEAEFGVVREDFDMLREEGVGILAPFSTEIIERAAHDSEKKKMKNQRLSEGELIM